MVRREFEDIRHGALSFIMNFDVVTGACPGLPQLTAMLPLFSLISIWRMPPAVQSLL